MSENAERMRFPTGPLETGGGEETATWPIQKRADESYPDAMDEAPEHFAKYLSVTPRDARWGIYATTVGLSMLPKAPIYPFDPSAHPPKYLFRWEMGRIFDEFALIYITRGEGSFKTEGDRSFRIGPGSLFMLFPEVWHWYRPDPEVGWDEYWVGFKGDYPVRLVEEGFFSPDSPVLEIGLHDSILGLYEEIIDGAKNENPGFQQTIASLVTNLLARVSTFPLRNEKISSEDRIVERAKFLLADNVSEELDIGWLSRSLGLGYSRFRTMFKRRTGLSPYQYFLDLKIAKAKKLLGQQRYSVKEISHLLSFDDPYYFSHLFKKKTGVPPSRWKSPEGG
jgi:AraC-like DNA-binding protein